MADVVVLADGYSGVTNKRMVADATCSLIKTSDELILVDTLGPWASIKLIDLINKQGFCLEDITYVVCTHGHADHLGNLNLFTNNTTKMATTIQNQLSTEDNLSNDKQKTSKIKKHIVGNLIYNDDVFDWSDDAFKDKVYKINDNIEIHQTPGHTMSCVSVIVNNVTNKGKIAIVGDLFENELDLNNDLIWLGAGSESEELQRLNRKFILDNFDYIVPGHGKMFKVKK